ncbi:HAD family hydrolase [Humibacter ginsengiterrae]
MPAATSTRAVLFDLDDTLFAHRDAVERGLLAYVRGLGHPYDASDADAETAFWRRLEEQHYHRYLGGELSHEEQRRARAREYAARHGVTLTPEAAAAWFSDYFEHYTDEWGLFDDALPCLDSLRARLPGVRLGIVTNGELDYQLRKIDAIGIRDRFDAIVASGDVGITKPDVRIFQLACTRLEVEPEQAAYVGDRLGTDAIGAARAGLTGVWIDRYGAEVSESEHAAAEQLGVARITGLPALPAALDL